MKTFFQKPSVVTLLVGDLPIYDNKKKGNIWHKYNYDSEQKLIKNIINKNNYTKIPIINNNNYHLFPNHNKTKMNVISFSLDEKNNKNKEKDTDEEINICFTKLSSISLDLQNIIGKEIKNQNTRFAIQPRFSRSSLMMFLVVRKTILKWQLVLPE